MGTLNFQLSCTIKQGLANQIYDIKILLLLNLKLAFDFPRKHIDNKFLNTFRNYIKNRYNSYDDIPNCSYFDK